jgi:hypothetical protein
MNKKFKKAFRLLGFPAYVDIESETLFGSVLTELMIKRAWKYDLEKILKRVSTS